MALCTQPAEKGSAARRGLLWRLVHRPRETFLRRALFQVHLWAGIAIGLLTTIVGISGSAIVYKHDLERRLTPALYRTTSTPRLSADALMARAENLHPGWTLEYVATEEASPSALPDPWILYLAPPGSKSFEKDVLVYLDPGTGKVLGETRRSTVLHPASLIDWTAELHYRLLAGETGLVVNGIGAALLFVLCVSGLILWWPGRKHWRSHLKVHWRARWPRLNWDLHNVIGLWTTLPLAVEALTGVLFCFYLPTATLLVTLLGGNAQHLRELFSAPLSAAPHTRQALVEPMVRTALRAYPGSSLYGITPPADASGSVLIRLAPPHAADRGDFILMAFDQYSGQLLRQMDSRQMGFAARVLLFMGPLHFGSFAGNVSRMAWVLLGLTPGLLFFTGFLMWWRRVPARRIRQQSVPS